MVFDPRKIGIQILDWPLGKGDIQMAESLDSARLPEAKFQRCVAVCHLTPLCLNFLPHKVGVTDIPAPGLSIRLSK